MIIENQEQFIAFLAVMSYNKQKGTEYDPKDFTVTSITPNQNTAVAYEVYGRPSLSTLELHLRLYCNYTDNVNRVEDYLFVESYEDYTGTRINIFSGYTLLNADFLAYTNNVIRQNDPLILNDPSLLPYFLEENGVVLIRLEDGTYLLDEHAPSTV